MNIKPVKNVKVRTFRRGLETEYWKAFISFYIDETVIEAWERMTLGPPVIVKRNKTSVDLTCWNGTDGRRMSFEL